MAQKCIIFYNRHFGLLANVNVQFDGGYGRAINMNTNIYVRNRFNHKALNVTLTLRSELIIHHDILQTLGLIDFDSYTQTI